MIGENLATNCDQAAQPLRGKMAGKISGIFMDVKVPPPRPTFSHSTSLSCPLSPPLLPPQALATIGHHGLSSATAGRSSRGAAVDVGRDFGVIGAERMIVFADSFLYRSYMLAMLLPFSTNTCSYSAGLPSSGGGE